MKTSHPAPNPDRVTELLKLKTLERPTERFWQDFDRDLRTRLLCEAVIEPTWPERIRGLLRWLVSIVPVAAGGAAALVLFFGHPTPAPNIDAFALELPASAKSPSVAPAAATTTAAADTLARANSAVSTTSGVNAVELEDARKIPAQLEMRAVYRGNFSFVAATLESIVETGPAMAAFDY